MNVPHMDNSLGWRGMRFKYLAEVTKGRLPASSDFKPLTEDATPYLSLEYLRGEIDEPKLVSVGTEFVHAHEGDTLLLWDGANAGEFLCAKQGVVSSTIALVLPRGVDVGFLYWACKGQEDFLRAQTTGMGIPHVSRESLANMRILLPDEVQQRAIADHLDRETARLDALIAAKQRLLELLAEKRQALIVRAVTRGLDPNVPKRDTDIPWLGRIPSHWEIWKLGHVASIGNGSTPNRNNAAYWSDGRIPWVNSGVVNQSEVTEADQFVTVRAVRECRLPLVKAGSVLVAIVGQGKNTRSGSCSLD